jgi:hypothetical protein
MAKHSTLMSGICCAMVTSFSHPPTSRNTHDAIEFDLASEFIGGNDSAWMMDLLAELAPARSAEVATLARKLS